MRYNSFDKLKKQACLLLLLIMVFLLFSSCSDFELFSKAGFKPSRFKQITITDNCDQVSVFTDERKIEYYIEAFNSAEQTENDISDDLLYEYQVVLDGKKPKHSREFTMYIDEKLENKNLFIIIDNKPRRIGEEYFNSLLTETVFEPVYAMFPECIGKVRVNQ